MPFISSEDMSLHVVILRIFAKETRTRFLLFISSVRSRLSVFIQIPLTGLSRLLADQFCKCAIVWKFSVLFNFQGPLPTGAGLSASSSIGHVIDLQPIRAEKCDIPFFPPMVKCRQATACSIRTPHWKSFWMRWWPDLSISPD